MKRLKILVIAHEFSPFQGSECAVGWNIVSRLAKYHDLTVLYASGSQFKQDIYKEAVDLYFSTHTQIDGLELINIDQPRLTKLISAINTRFLSAGSIGIPVLYFLGYKYWQKAVLKKVELLLDNEHFDVIHQLTQISFREPGYAWKFRIPFIWGPTGGMYSINKEFLRLVSLRTKLFEVVRSFSNFFQFNYVTRVKQANRNAEIIYSFSKEDAELFRLRAKGQVKLMLDAGAYVHPMSKAPLIVNEKQVIGIWCGQLIDRKAPAILLKAIRLIKDRRNFKLLIIGSGPLEAKLKKLTKEFKIDNVDWIGSVSHNEVFELMQKADFFVHTSYREATSTVIPEALSNGLPVICHDINGMSIAVNDTCGIKIPLISPDNSIAGFSDAINILVTDKERLSNLKKGALIRAKEISWDVMVEEIANDYQGICQKR